MNTQRPELSVGTLLPIPYGKQEITPDDVKAVVDVLTSDFLTQGPTIPQFERDFASYCGARYAVAVANGTAALHLAALALGVDHSSHVITTPITFAASANCVRFCGGTVHFADIDPSTATLSIAETRKLLEAVPKGTFTGIIPVDFAGLPVDGEAFRQMADEFGLWILQDCCHSPGGFSVDSRGIKQISGNCAYSHVSVFSFHPVKHIACGEGGMITTNDPEIYSKILLLRSHGITRDPDLLIENHGGWYYEMQALGYNYRLTDFQAALGLSQLKRADANLARRKAIAQRYGDAFQGTRAQPLTEQSRCGHAYHLYILRVPERKALYDYLKEQGIYTQVHYIPVHMLPYYRQLGHQEGRYPDAEAYYRECLSIPMYPSLQDNQVEYVISKVKAFFLESPVS